MEKSIGHLNKIKLVMPYGTDDTTYEERKNNYGILLGDKECILSHKNRIVMVSKYKQIGCMHQ